MNEQIAELRDFLRALNGHGGQPRRIPAVLRSIARRGAQPAHEADDLLQDVLADLLRRRGQQGGVDPLLDLGDAELLRAVSRRFVQVRATRLGDRWRLLKSIRAHVSSALARPAVTATGLPVSVTQGDRISGQLIAQAVNALLEEPDGPEPTVHAVAHRLFELYFVSAPNEDHECGLAQHDEGSSDVAVHAAALRRQLGDDLFAIVMRRAHGRTLGESGGGLAPSSVHARLQTAATKITDYARLSGMERRHLQAVFEHCSSRSVGPA